jgi:type I restriction enzyme, R subunit
MTENDLEQLAIAWFQDAGWSYRHGPDIAPDSDAPARDDWRQVVLRGELATALAQLNPGLPATALDEAALLATRPEEPSQLQGNRRLHELLCDGVAVEVTDTQGLKRGDRVRLIDFDHPERNRFLVVNQFTIQGSKQPRRPDLVCFINGLPIAVIELKNPPAEAPRTSGAPSTSCRPTRTRSPICSSQRRAGDLRWLQARIGSLTADRERFLPWRTVKDENDRPLLEFELETVVRGFFAPALLLDYLRYFILFEQADGQLIKKIAGYHQFHAVREAVRATVIAATRPAGHGAGGARHLRPRGAAGLAQGRHRVAHAGLGQEHLDAVLRRQS